MKPFAAAAVAAALTVAVPASASAATLAVDPAKPCYRSGERMTLTGAGFSPSSSVAVTVDGDALGTLPSDDAGAVSGGLTLRRPSGQRRRRLVATDSANPALSTSLGVLLTAVDVRLHPSSGPPGRTLRIGGRGFTTGRTLYAHVIKGRSKRTVRIGRLRGPCHIVKARRRLFRGDEATGRYLVQFDTKRRFSKRTQVKSEIGVNIFKVRPSAARATWASLG